MLTGSCRVVTSSGLRRIAEITPGIEVLTHESRFRRVALVQRGVHTGPIVRVGKLVAVPTLTRVRVYDRWELAADHLNTTMTIRGVTADEWAASEARVPLGTVARGVAFSTGAKGGVVMGVSPTALLGAILFSARSDAYEMVHFEADSIGHGEMVFSLRVEEDDSFVAERVCVRWQSDS